MSILDEATNFTPEQYDRVALIQLRERVAGLTGPSRDVDADIAVATGLAVRRSGRKGVEWAYEGKPSNTFSFPDEYTASIDAALALVERVLPGWRVSKIEDLLLGRRWYCELMQMHDRKVSAEFPVVDAEADTLPVSILTCLLDALISQEEQLRDDRDHDMGKD